MGGAYIYFDRIGNPDSSFRLSDPEYEYRNNIATIRANIPMIHTRFITMENIVQRVLPQSVSGPNSSELRQLIRNMGKLFEKWRTLFDIPGSNDYDNAVRIAATIREDVPQLEAMFAQYRSLDASFGGENKNLDALEQETALLKRYLDDTARRQAEIEKVRAQ